jgi:hypothetical protein
VASVAAVALLEPEIRSAASLESSLEYFEFQNVRGGTSGSFTSRDERPLTTLEGKPEFLSRARRWLTATNAGEFGGFALLLAQYGEFDGLDQAIARTTSSRADAETDLDSVVLTGIALSHEVKYVPVLRRMAEGQTEDYELRRILQALRGMTGAEARQLRLDINRQMRKNVGSSPFD